MPLDALEYVVRPYSTPGPHGSTLIPSTPRASRERATLTWGSKSTMPDVSTGENFTVVCCKDTLKEKDRKTKPHRYFQNNDPKSNNWVDVDWTVSMNLDKKEHNTCGDNFDDISGAAAEIDQSLAEFATLFHSGTTNVGTADKNCGATWQFPDPPPDVTAP